jgi:cardiolipin synthase
MSDLAPETTATDPTLERLRRITMGITAGRLVSALLIGWLIYSGHYAWAFWLFVLAAFGALLEGSAALLFKTRTRLGGVLDGFADRLLPLLALTALSYNGLLPLWVLIPVLLRELVLALGQKLPETAGNEPWIREPRWLFHINIVAMDALAILFLLIQGPGFGVDLFILPAELLVVGLVLASLVLAFFSRPKPEDEFLNDDPGKGA